MNQRPQSDDAIGRSATAKAMWRILPLILLVYMVGLYRLYGRTRVTSERRGRAAAMSRHSQFHCDFPGLS